MARKQKPVMDVEVSAGSKPLYLPVTRTVTVPAGSSAVLTWTGGGSFTSGSTGVLTLTAYCDSIEILDTSEYVMGWRSQAVAMLRGAVELTPCNYEFAHPIELMGPLFT